MHYTTRELPFDEWKKLTGTELAHLSALPAPIPGVTVLVVEDPSTREMLACWAATTVVHVEGLWMDTAAQHNPAIGRALLHGMSELLWQAYQAREVLTQAADPTIADMLARMGGRPVPGETWVFPVPEPGRTN